jgi:hypothetical protein
VTVLPTGMINLPDALERLVAAIHGEWAVAPIKNHKVHAGVTFRYSAEDDAPEFQLAVRTFERDGHKTTYAEDENRWKSAREKISTALAGDILTAQMDLDERRHDVPRNYWDSFAGDKPFETILDDAVILSGFEIFTFHSGEFRADPDEVQQLKFNGLPVFIDKASFYEWLAVEIGREQSAPKNVTENNSAQALPSKNILPPYLAFMTHAATELGLTKGKKFTKEEIKLWLHKHWPGELGSPSERDLSSMATHLRPPDAKLGGHFKR